MSSTIRNETSAGPRYKHRPGKGTQPVQHSPLYSSLLLAIHSGHLIYVTVRGILSKTYDLLTGFILTSSSKELIKSDISTLNKIPSHLAVIVSEHDLERLINDVADLAAWSVCSSIPILTIYEAKGELKGMESSLQVAIKRKLRRYFREVKKIVISTPAWGTRSHNFADDDTNIPDLEINILSRDDGREAILELTRSLCNLARKPIGQDSAKAISTNGSSTRSLLDSTLTNEHNSALKRSGHATPVADTSDTAPGFSSDDVTIPLVDAHLTSSTIAEPNLLLVFSRQKTLDGFPPWSMRLCEICYVGRTGHVSYRGFLKGLQRYGRAEMRFGH